MRHCLAEWVSPAENRLLRLVQALQGTELLSLGRGKAGKGVNQGTMPEGEQNAQPSLGLNGGTAVPVPVLSGQAWWQLSQHQSCWHRY